jgi:hypothetical protein
MSTSPNGGGDDGSLEEGEDEFTVADLGITEYKRVAERPRKEFAPWHRPRKQFVRKFQWVACLQDIYVGRDPEDRINYLGLPGTDLLDLRVFYDEVCVPQNRMLRFLGFHQGIESDSSESVSLDISLQQVKLRELVHESSKVLTDDIKKIGSPNSIAYQEALRAAPYDVINLDFTVGFARDAPGSLDSVYSALNLIIAMQQRLQQWLLLMTGLIGREVFDSAAAEKLHALFLGTLECEGFRDACSEYFESPDLDSLDIDSCSDSDYFYAMAIGFCVWVFRQAQQAGSPRRVNLRAAFYYQHYPNGPRPDMLSIAIRFTPKVVAATDPSGLAVAGRNRVDQCEASLQFATKLHGAANVDERLENNNALRDELVEETVSLLLEAGYDETDYRQWVARFVS